MRRLNSQIISCNCGYSGGYLDKDIEARITNPSKMIVYRINIENLERIEPSSKGWFE